MTEEKKSQRTEIDQTAEHTPSSVSEIKSVLMEVIDNLNDEQDDAILEVVEPSPDELEEIEEDEDLTSPPTSIRVTDDPVRMYLREIGRVPLLEAHQEVWLSTQQEAAVHLHSLQSRLKDKKGNPPDERKDADRPAQLAA